MVYEAKPKFWALWVEAIQSFWRDPKNVLGERGDLVRRIVKFAWLVLAFYILIFVAGPSQVASWQLWMANDSLAEHLAWGFTIASALCFAVVRFASEGTEPLRVPIFLPIVEFEERRWKGFHIRSARLHVPNPTVLAGSALVAGLLVMSFLGMWNYYMNESRTVGGASIIATTGASSAESEALAALQAHRTGAAERAANGEAELARTPEAYATARSRIRAANTEQARLDAETDRRLAAELTAARAANVTTALQFSDPRPVDAVVAGAFGAPRDVVASLLDAMRSLIVEVLLILGAGLSLTGATARPVGKPLDARETPELEPEEPALNDVDPPPAAPQEDERRYRFTLPTATDEDVETANAIGPTQPETAPPEEPAPEPAPDADPAPEPAQADADPIEDDPLAADHMMNEPAHA